MEKQIKKTPNFIPYDSNQNVMVAINFQDQLHAGTFEYAINYLVENRIDLTSYFSAYQNADTGRPAYDPAILLKIILFAYSKGITSSREIEWNCQTNITFMALSCDTVPHYTTIAGFISGHPESVESIFEQILLTCEEDGLLGHELFAIDGCKMSSDASKEWSGTIKELEQKRDKIKKLITHHIEEDKKLSKNEPKEETRIKRAKQAAETLTAAHEKIEIFLKTAKPRMGKGKQKNEVKSNITDNESAKMTTSKGTIQGYNGVTSVDKKHQIIIDAQAFGEGQEHHTLQPVLETIKDRYARLGFSDNLYEDDIIVTADTGFANEANIKYLHENEINGYIPDTQFRSRDPKFAHQKTKYGKRKRNNKTKTQAVIPASKFKYDPKEKSCECPAGESMWLKKEGQDKSGNYKVFFEGRISKCRHCAIKQDCMRNPLSADTRTGNGRQVSFVIEKKRKPNYTDWMKKRVDSAEGKQIYSHRMSVVEPVFGNIGSNKRLNKFSLRGKTKVENQWKLYCIVHNIEKIKNYGQIAV
jgi:transposase